MPISNQDVDYTYLGDVPANYKVPIPGAFATVRGASRDIRGFGGENSGGATEQIWGRPQYTAEMARTAVFGKSPADVFQWQKKLANAGYLSSFRIGDPGGSTYAAVKTAMAEANLKGIDDKDLLKQKAAYNAAVARGQKGTVSGGSSTNYTATNSSTSSMTSTSVNLTGRGTAESILRNALLQELGRAPTDKEVGDFKRALNRSERKNPSVTKTNQSSTTTTKVSGHNQSSSTSGSSTSTTKQSDVDPNEEALDYAQGKPLKRERTMYQDSLYYEVISDMLGL
jgi:hypothetical protein